MSRSIYLRDAAALLLRVSSEPSSSRGGKDLTGTCHSSKHTKDLAQSYGFRGIIAGTRKTTPGIVMPHYGVALDMLIVSC